MPIKPIIGGVEINTDAVVPVIDTPLERFRNKRVIVTGDSLTAQSAATQWHQYLTAWLYFRVCYNDGKSGTGVSNPYSTQKCIYERIDDSEPKGWDFLYTTIPDYIIAMLSINDLSQQGLSLGTTADITSGGMTFNTSYYGNVRMLIEKLHAKYPLIPLGIITPIPWATHYGRTDTFYAWNQAIIDVCKHFSVPCLDLFTASDFRPWNATWCAAYQTDGTHPNAAGQKIIAYKIYEFCKQYL